MPFPTVNYVEIKSLHQLYEIYDIDCAGSLSKDNYSHPLKPYHLTNTEARCQYLKGKTVCGQQHQFGYVVETKEGEKVIVGHCCALKHLGIDDKEIQNDFSKARRNEDYERRRAKVLKFLSSRDAVADELKNLEKDSEHFFLEASRIVQLLPDRILKNLVDRWKRRDLLIKLRLLKPKMRDKGNGKQEILRYEWSSFEFPPLRGLGPWLQPRSMSSTTAISKLREHLNHLPRHSLLSINQLKEAEGVIREITDLDNLKAQLSLELESMHRFCEKENLWLLAYLSDDRKLRAETLRSVHAILRETPPIETSRMISEIDSSLREKHGASSLKLAS